MTVRELIKHLETCDLDKQVALIISVLSENVDTENSVNLLLREVIAVVENQNMVGIQ